MRREVSGSLLLALIEEAEARGVGRERLFAGAPEEVLQRAQPRSFVTYNAFDWLLAQLCRLSRDPAAPRGLGRRFVVHLDYGLGRYVLPGLDSPQGVIEAGAHLLDQAIRPLKAAVQHEDQGASQLVLKLDPRLPLEQSLTWFLIGAAEGLLELIDARRRRIDVIDLQLSLENYRPDEVTRFEVGADGQVFKLQHEPRDAGGRLVKRQQLGELSADGTFIVDGVRLGAPRSLLRLRYSRRRRPLISLVARQRARAGGLNLRQVALDQREGMRRGAEELIDLERRIEDLGRISEIVNALIEEIKRVTNLSELIQLMATAVCGSFGFDRSLIFLVRDNTLNIVSSHNPYDAEWAQVCYSNLQATPIKLDDGLHEAQVLLSGRPLAVSEAGRDTRVSPLLRNVWNSSSYAIVPIRGRERSMGLLLVDHYYKRREIGAEDLEMLSSMSNIAGLALDKLLVIGSLEEKVDERTRALSSANSKLTQLYQRAKESERLKSMFLANVSHELRTPLNSIIGFSKVILGGIDGPISAQQRTDLTVIHNEGVHLLGVINDILDLTKIEAGHMELHVETMDLEPTARDVLRAASGLLGDKQLELKAEIEPGLPRIAADKMRVRQILLNLMSNAVKFTEAGTVKLGAAARPSELLVWVSDTGRGMAPDEIPLAFAEFCQLDDSPGRRAGGTGLGLTITKRLVELHNGRIWVVSKPGEGSTFYFTLPTGPPPADVNPREQGA